MNALGTRSHCATAAPASVEISSAKPRRGTPHPRHVRSLPWAPGRYSRRGRRHHGQRPSFGRRRHDRPARRNAPRRHLRCAPGPRRGHGRGAVDAGQASEREPPSSRRRREQRAGDQQRPPAGLVAHDLRRKTQAQPGADHRLPDLAGARRGLDRHAEHAQEGEARQRPSIHGMGVCSTRSRSRPPRRPRGPRAIVRCASACWSPVALPNRTPAQGIGISLLSASSEQQRHDQYHGRGNPQPDRDPAAIENVHIAMEIANARRSFCSIMSPSTKPRMSGASGNRVCAGSRRTRRACHRQ